jgi:hypothetical protein
VMTGQEPVTLERLDVVTPTAAELAAYAGSYYSDELQSTFSIVFSEGALELHRRGAAPQPLRPLARDEFAVGPMTLRFARGADGAPASYLLDMGRIRNLHFERAAAAR